MTNRELLELAAKAAGIDVVRSRLDDPLNRDFLVNASARNPYQVSGAWNPLTDDGDALRLAVKLAIDFKIRNGATWWDHQESDGFVYWRHEPHGADPLAATRRAIARAAAEIGKAMV